VDADGELQILRVEGVVRQIFDHGSAKPRVSVEGIPVGVMQ
jgi:hypothetical protein